MSVYPRSTRLNACDRYDDCATPKRSTIVPRMAATASKKLPAQELLLSGAVSGLSSCIVLQPLDRAF